jgi:protein-S-isoprenylcysteine O-methyltransferase Ste14
MDEPRLPKIISTLLRPVFAAMLALSQFLSQRAGILTQDAVVVGVGIAITLAGLWLWLAASHHLRPAQGARIVATTGPYRLIRHPVYASIYLICIGMGLVFFAWLWFVVLLAFAPLWWLEAKTEEGAMLATYGEAYLDYRDRTAMWIPGVW